MSNRKKHQSIDSGALFGSYQIQSFIGHGAFGDIYTCCDERDSSFWAIKLELKLNKKASLNKEANFLQKIQGHKYFPIYKDYGETNDYRFLIMELLGPSLLQAKRVCPDGIYSASTAIRIGIEMLKCIEQFHSLGYLHRDIKPGNFLIRPSRSNPLALIDFGLSRSYIDDNGKLLSAREHPGFVGTVPYASINAHKGLELGRCDDLYSWFLVLLKIHTGELPWPNVNDKSLIFDAKNNCNMASFCVGLPPQYLSIYRIIMGMKREDTPNYALLYQLLAQAMLHVNASFFDPFDWEKIPKETTNSISHIPLQIPKKEEPDIPENLSEELVQKLSVIPESTLDDEEEDSTNHTLPRTEVESVAGGCICLLI